MLKEVIESMDNAKIAEIIDEQNEAVEKLNGHSD